MEGMVAFVLLLVGVLLALPLAVLIQLTRLREQAKQLTRRIALLEGQLAELQRPPPSGDQPSADSVTAGSTAAPEPEDATLASLQTARDAMAAVRQPKHPSEAVTPWLPQPQRSAPCPPAPSRQASEERPLVPPESTRPAPAVAAFNWEQFMGVRLFAWIGGLALFLAVAFLVKYSFDHDLISPAMRVGIGFAAGLGLLAGGLRLSRERYKITADTLCATGTVILYAATYASHAVYTLDGFGVVSTFLIMSMITFVAFFIAVWADARVVAVLGMLGGFLTPVLVSTGVDRPVALFTYIALLDLGLFAVTAARRWDWLHLAGAAGTVAMLLGWAARFYTPEKVFIAMTVFLGFGVMYLGATVWMRRRGPISRWLIAAPLLPPAATFVFTFVLVQYRLIDGRPGVFFAFLFGADALLLALSWLVVRSAVLTRADGSPLPILRLIEPVSGGVVFLLLAWWIGAHVNDELLYWALGGALGFALLHAAFPLVLLRRHPGAPVAVWTHLFPVLSLVLTLIPIIRFEEVSLLVWPAVLVIDLVVIVLAVATVSLAGMLLALVVTAAVVLSWLLRMPADVAGLTEQLLVLTALAAVFTVAAAVAGPRIVERRHQAGRNTLDGWLLSGRQPADVQRHIAALSGLLPFLLLTVVVIRLPLANPTPVFTVALLLAGLLLGLGRLTGLAWLPAVGLGCVILVEHTWHFLHFTGAAPGVALGWYLGFHAVFSLYPFLFHRCDGSKVVAWTTGALAGPLHFWLVYDLVRRAWPNDVMGLVPALFALPALAGLLATARQIPADHPRRNALLAWFGGVALFFVTLVFPIQFERQWLTVAWALEGAALLWLFRRVPHSGLRYAGVGLLAAAFVRLGLNPEVFRYQPRADIPILNWYLYAYGLVSGALFAGAKLLRPPHHRLYGKDARPLLVTLGVALVFLLVNIEIADFFTEPGQAALVFSFRGHFARDMTYTIGWALFAFVLLVAGILWRARPARWAGIGLLGVTLLKLFLHDLATLRQLYRVGALACVAVVAIVASFLYQKFFAATLTAGSTTGADQTEPETETE